MYPTMMVSPFPSLLSQAKALAPSAAQGRLNLPPRGEETNAPMDGGAGVLYCSPVPL